MHDNDTQVSLGLLDQSSASAPNLSALALTVRQSCVELMADYGVRATPQKWRDAGDPPSAPRAPLAAQVAFTGQSLRGWVALCATQSVIREAAHGAAGMQTQGPRSLADWNRELVNQLLGRIKNKLRTQDVSVDVGVPTPLASLEASARACDIRQRFSSAAGTFSVFLAVLFDAGLVLGKCSIDEELPSEGQLLLF